MFPKLWPWFDNWLKVERSPCPAASMEWNMKIAVIGSGISGLLAARLLAADHDIHVFEANNYAGGHTNTVSFEAFGRQYAADTGFMVFNDRTYPNFVRMLQMLDVPARNSDMSFSVRCDKTGLEYQGSSLNGLFAQRRNLVRPSFYRMLLDVLRFNRQSLELLQGEDYESGVGPVLGPQPVQPGVHRPLSHSHGCGHLVGAARAVSAVPGAIHRELLQQSWAPDGTWPPPMEDGRREARCGTSKPSLGPLRTAFA